MWALTVTAVGGTEDNEDILDQRDDGDGVEDERERVQNVVLVADAAGENGGEHVHRRRSDVAVHDSHALERQPKPVPPI